MLAAELRSHSAPETAAQSMDSPQQLSHALRPMPPDRRRDVLAVVAAALLAGALVASLAVLSRHDFLLFRCQRGLRHQHHQHSEQQLERQSPGSYSSHEVLRVRSLCCQQPPSER